MSDRSYHQPKTQGVQHVIHNLTLLGQGGNPLGLGATTARFGEGDPNGSFFTVTRNAIGQLTLKTKDGFPAVVFATAQPSAGYMSKCGPPTKNADNTWSIPIYTVSDKLSVVGITLTTAGAGYSTVPPMYFTGMTGVGASAVATIASGAVVVSPLITSPGYGYTTAPSIGFSGLSGGSGAIATAILGTNLPVDIPTGNFIYVQLTTRNSQVLP